MVVQHIGSIVSLNKSQHGEELAARKVERPRISLHDTAQSAVGTCFLNGRSIKAMTSENAPTHARQYEEREPDLHEKGHRCARSDATTTLGFQTTADPPRQNAVELKKPSKCKSSVLPIFYAMSTYLFHICEIATFICFD